MIAKLKDYFCKSKDHEQFDLMETQTQMHVSKLREALKKAEERAQQVADELEEKINNSQKGQ